MALSANGSWFTITLNGRTDLGVYAFFGYEALSEPFAFTVEVVYLSPSLDIASFLGKPACLTIKEKTGELRYVNGLVREMRQLHTASLRTHYEAVIVPRFWYLRETCNHRIFQNQTVPDIIRAILQEQGFVGEASDLRLQGTYEPREYCVQYRESDFHFISRLCEEEGIYYYFTHSASGHCLTFADMPGGPIISGKSSLRFFPGSGQPEDEAVLSRLGWQGRIASDTTSYREWNFQKPRLDLSVSDSKINVPVPGGMYLENYTYPHVYNLKKPGERYAALSAARQTCMNLTVQGVGDVCRLTPGLVFSVREHFRPDLNAAWLTHTVRHFGEQPQVLEHEAPDRGFRYRSEFIAMPHTTRFLPPVRHPKERIVGKQTAIVTGPKGEEIYPDKYGCVKVQFFWDRAENAPGRTPDHGAWTEKTSCWVRVSQAWAGSLYGTEALPRVGHEVIVSFLEGDPDRPIITGRVYHALNMPPYPLPDNKTRTVFKSMSTPGSEQEERGYHELRIEDKKDEEEIFLHAQKDVNIHTKNDWKEHILHDFHRTVERHSTTLIKQEEHHLGEKPRKTRLLKEEHLTVHEDQHTEYKTKWLAKADDEIHLESLIKAVLEAGADLTLKVGPSFVHMSGSGIEIVGPVVNINSGGAPGVGTPAKPELPADAIPVGGGHLEICASCLRKARQLGTPVIGSNE